MKIVLGTAQFGQNYGITNKDGAVTNTMATAILKTAYDAGITHIDTAQLYGQSEAVIGSAEFNDFKIISKIAITDEQTSTAEKLHISLKNLRKTKIYGLLIHNADVLKDQNRGAQIWAELKALKQKGLIQKIGASFYTPEDLTEGLNYYDFDIVQFPCNILDQRFLTPDLQSILTEKNIEQHARSLFLQGVLLSKQNALPEYFQDKHNVLKPYFEALNIQNITPLAMCFYFLRHTIQYKAPSLKAVIGVTNDIQLREIVDTYKTAFTNIERHLDFEALASDNLNVIDPRSWST